MMDRKTVDPAGEVPRSKVSGLIRRQSDCGVYVSDGGECTQSTKEKWVLQRRLDVGEIRDPLESEADRIAAQVIAAPVHEAVRPMFPGVQRLATTGSDRVGAAPASVERTLDAPGMPLRSDLRQDMEWRFGYDFARVRLHTDMQAARSAQDIGASAYAMGHHVVFGPGQFQPSSREGRFLVAHELTHVLQQTGAGAAHYAPVRSEGARPATVHAGGRGMVQRTLTEEQLTSTPDTAIRRDPDYIDNRITRIEFYTAELAIIHYEGGAQLRLGLVPGEIQPPVVGVDYRTRRSEHAVLESPGPGQTRFLPHARQVQAPDATFEQVARELGRTITYHVDASSHRIVPTEVNDITAPRLCEVLRQAEAEYVRTTDEMAQGMVRALRILEVAVILASFIPTGGESAAVTAGRGAGTAGAAEAGVLGRAVGVLRQFFLRLLRSGGTEVITVEGVGFGGLRVLMSEGRVMTVLRNTIVNVERIPAQGRLIHSAFEQAAIAAAREAGAVSVRVGVQTVVNTQWGAYLESLGYAYELLPTATGFSKVLIRTLTL